MLIDFWTYTCINCIRTLPYVEVLGRSATATTGCTVVGVHSPEFPFEKDAGNVAGRDRPARHRPTRSSRTTTSAPGTRSGTSTGRPTYLIDAHGNVRYVALRRGRLRRDREARSARCSPRPAHATSAPRRGPGRRRGARRRDLRTPETYLGSPARAGLGQRRPQPGEQGLRGARPGLARAQPVRLRRAPGRSATRTATAGAGADDRRRASRRAGSSWCSARPGRPRTVQVLLDGKPIPATLAGDDVRRGAATIDGPAPLPARRPAGGLHSTASPCASTPGSRATPSPSARTAAGRQQPRAQRAEREEGHRDPGSSPAELWSQVG